MATPFEKERSSNILMSDPVQQTLSPHWNPNIYTNTALDTCDRIIAWFLSTRPRSNYYWDYNFASYSKSKLNWTKTRDSKPDIVRYDIPNTPHYRLENLSVTITSLLNTQYPIFWLPDRWNLHPIWTWYHCEGTMSVLESRLYVFPQTVAVSFYEYPSNIQHSDCLLIITSVRCFRSNVARKPENERTWDESKVSDRERNNSFFQNDACTEVND